MQGEIRMKRFIVIIIVTIFAIVAYFIIDEKNNYSGDNLSNWLKEMEEEWGIEFGNAKKYIYSKSNKEGLQGDGNSYFVIQYKNKSTTKKMLNWKKTDENDKKYIKGILDDLEIDKKYRPVSNNTYMYKKVSSDDKFDEIYVIYDSSNPANLFILERFI